jgi:hypothetical protein
VLPWEKPTEEELAAWEAGMKKKCAASSQAPFSMEWCCENAIGFFLFSQFIKETAEDYGRINFVEEVLRFKKLSTGGRQARLDKAVDIANQFLGRSSAEISMKKTEIEEYDLARTPVAPEQRISGQELEAMMKLNMDYPTCSESVSGVKGPVREEIMQNITETQGLFDLQPRGDSLQEAATTAHDHGKGGDATQDTSDSTEPLEQHASSVHGSERTSLLRSLQQGSHTSSFLPSTLFDKAEILAMESLRREYWDFFCQSAHFIKLKNFLWYQDRKVSPDDFFVMRILGRGGFGLVYGACQMCR